MLSSETMAAAPPVKFPILVLLIRGMGLVAAVIVLVWSIKFRGGMAFISTDPTFIFNVHPVLMVIGFVVLSGEAMLAYKTVPGTKTLKKAVHLFLLGLAFFLSLIGLWAAWKYHSDMNIDNFYSLHSWIGLACLSLFGIQWGAAFITYWYPGGSRGTRMNLMPWHVYMGIYIYGLAITAAVTGILEKLTFLQSSKTIARYSVESLLVNFLGILMVVLGGAVVLAVISSPIGKGEAYRGTSE